MLNGKDLIIHLIVGLIKKISYKKWVNIFLNHQIIKAILKFEINYATKADINNISHVDASNFAL